MCPLSSPAPQQAWPVFHAFGNFQSALQGATQVAINFAGESLMIFDAIDLVDIGLTNGNSAFLAIGASDGSSDRVPFFRGFTYASSQGSYSWRGQVMLAGNSSLWLINNLGDWAVTWHALIVPSYAGQQFNQG